MAESGVFWGHRSNGSRRRNPPESCPRPLYPQDCPEENHNIPEDHQGEDLMDIKVEVKDEVEETMDVWADQQDGSRRRNPPESCPRPLCPQDCPEENHSIPEDHQREDLISIKVEENLEEAMRGGQPCMNVVKEETPDVTTDGSRRRNPPERCPRPLCPQDCPEENHNIPEDHQGEDLIDIKVEVKDEVEETMDIWADQQGGSRRINPPERCPRPLCPQDCPEENHNIPEDHQREDLISIKVEENLEEAMRGGQPCMNVVKEETPDVTTAFYSNMSSTEDLGAPQSGQDTNEDTSGAEQPEELSDDSSQGRRARVPEVPQREEANTIIDNEQLIHLVQERRALWDTRHRQHSDSMVIRRLWEEVARSLLGNWDRATTQVRKDFLKSVKVRWRSMKDRFNKDMREEIKVRSGAAPKLPKYKYHRMLAFLRPALVHRPTWSSTTEPGSSSVAVARQRPATERSQSSTRNAVTGQASQAGEQAAGPSGFPLSQPSSTAFVGTSRQRQRAWERSVMPEFIHLSSVFQDGMKVTGDRIDSVFTQVNTLLKDVHRQLDCLKANLQTPAQHFFSAIERGMSENLTPELQLNVMLACQAAYSQALQQSRSYHPQAGYYQQANIYFPTQQQGQAQHQWQKMTAPNYPAPPPLDLMAVPPIPSITMLQSAAPLQHAASIMLPSPAPLQHAASTTLPSLAPLQHAASNTLPSAAPLQHAASTTLASAAPLQHAASTTLASAAPLQHAASTTLPSLAPLQHAASNTLPSAASRQHAASTTLPSPAARQHTATEATTPTQSSKKRRGTYKNPTSTSDSAQQMKTRSKKCRP
ncbi:uncharacterized protein [Ranitomeya imitator]|uniref:uncharacterized protein isoform X2 n=1 Tax=Ranitomeya imitator TaxID=111125 RepID=UPI0037E9A5EF